MKSPIDLVRSLAADEFASLRAEVAAGRADNALKALRQRDAGAEIVREQYAGRYPLELVQNANDAVASEGATAARIQFRVTESALLVADTGAGFGTAQVESICDLAQSSKDPRKSVGYKGLGFKSVAEITDTPQVISGELRFSFDRGRLRREVEAITGRELDENLPLPDYAFPFELSDGDLGADVAAVYELQDLGFRTVMRLPFRNPAAAESAVIHVAETIVPRLLLFLDAAESLELVGTAEDFHAQALREGNDEQQYVILEAEDRSEQFMLYRKEVPIPDPELVAELDKAWRQVEAVRVAAAVPLDDAGQPKAAEAEPLHVYFPTEEETGLSVIFNADFQVELDRRRIASSGAQGNYNNWLIGELADLVAGAVVPDLSDRFGGAATVDVFAPHGPATHSGGLVTEALFAGLNDVAWIPCQDGALRAPTEVRLLPASVPSVTDLHNWFHLPELVQPEVEDDHRARELLTKVFDCTVTEVRAVLESLEPPPTTGATDFYLFLLAWSQSAGFFFGTWLKGSKCVLLQDGEWVRPTDDPKPFLPRQRAEDEFPPGLHIPVAELPDVPGLVDLLERAGMEPLTWRALVADFLLPRLTDRDVGEAERRDALAILRNYFDSIRRDGTGDREIRESVGEALLPARAQGVRTAVELRPAHDLYFGSDWFPEAELEVLYGPLGKADFLAIDANNVEEDRSFFEWLGVESHPRIRDLGPYRGPSAWRSSRAYNEASRCPQGHPLSQTLKSAPMIDRTDAIIASGDGVRLSVLWRHLVAEWDSAYRTAMVATWRCIAGAHRGERDRPFDSAAALLLRTTDWIPAVRSGRHISAPPSAIWRPPPGCPDAVRRLLTTMAPGTPSPTSSMADALGLVDGARADASAVVQLLVRLEEENEDHPALSDEVADAGIWLLAQLEGADGTEALTPGSVPIVARVRGELQFVRRPYQIRDPLLVEVWGDTLDVYEGDSHLPRVLASLEIPILDELVEVTPMPADRLEDVEQAVKDRLDEIGPALLATTAADYGSRRAEIARRLRALALVCTTELGLEYVLNSRSPRRALGASAFIHESTGYLAVDEGESEPDWSAFGPRLADYFDVALGDAFALLLDASPRGRHNYLQARHISDEDLQGAQQVLGADDAPDGVGEHNGWDFAEAEAEAEPEPDEGRADPENRADDQGPAGNDRAVDEASTSLSTVRARKKLPDVVREQGEIGDLDHSHRGDGPSTSDEGDSHPSVSPSGQRASSSSSHAGSRASARATSGTDVGKPESQPLSRFYSYVAATGSREARMAERQDVRAMLLGEHGVERVVAYEAARGRLAERQPHNNEGFDIISSRPDGSDRRIIEVKATAREWPDRGVPVSDSQIDKNRELGDEFWLYVVEHAEDPVGARVTAIQNPLAWADYFAFDPGWRALGELDVDGS